MIFDSVLHAKDYEGINPDIFRALEAARTYTPENYPGGRVELEGDRIFLNLASYETHAPEDALMEAHRQYIDVMYMVEGSETIYVKQTDKLSCITQEYEAEGDALLGKKDPDATAVRLEPGNFIILVPQDAHAPACHADGPVSVKKVIGKVRIG